MSTTNLRVIAAGAAAIVAVLTGLIGGWVGAHAGVCPAPTTQAAPSATNHPPEQGLAKKDTGSGSGGEAEDQQNLGAPAGQDCASFSVRTAAVGFVGAALAGGLAVALLMAGRRETAGAVPVASAPPAVGGDPGGAARLEQVESERATLVQTCVYVRDRATSKAIADTLGRALAEVGVTTLAPVGAVFDPAHHEAGGATATRDPAQAGTIAAVEVPGYLDRGAVLRAPVVTVYREGAPQ